MDRAGATRCGPSSSSARSPEHSACAAARRVAAGGGARAGPPHRGGGPRRQRAARARARRELAQGPAPDAPRTSWPSCSGVAGSLAPSRLGFVEGAAAARPATPSAPPPSRAAPAGRRALGGLAGRSGAHRRSRAPRSASSRRAAPLPRPRSAVLLKERPMREAVILSAVRAAHRASSWAP